MQSDLTLGPYFQPGRCHLHLPILRLSTSTTQVMKSSKLSWLCMSKRTGQSILSEPFDMKNVFGTSAPGSDDGPLSIFLQPVFNKVSVQRLPASLDILYRYFPGCPTLQCKEAADAGPRSINHHPSCPSFTYTHILLIPKPSSSKRDRSILTSSLRRVPYIRAQWPAIYVGPGDLHNPTFNGVVKSSSRTTIPTTSTVVTKCSSTQHPSSSRRQNQATLRSTERGCSCLCLCSCILHDWQMRRLHTKVIERRHIPTPLFQSLPAGVRDQP
jgi:hypothetical protein